MYKENDLCKICGDIPDKTDAFIVGGEIRSRLHKDVKNLEIWSDVPIYHNDYNVRHSASHVKVCPSCGDFFLYTCRYEYLVCGSEDEIFVNRLKYPLDIFQVLMTHKPHKDHIDPYKQQLAIFKENSDIYIRNLTRSYLSGKKSEKKKLKNYKFYTATISGKSIDNKEVLPVLLDCYSYLKGSFPIKSKAKKITVTSEIKNKNLVNLTDLNFLEEKCSKGDIHSLIEAFKSQISQIGKDVFIHPSRAIVNKSLLEKILTILIRYRDFLDTNGEMLFQTLYNSGYWQDCASAREHYIWPAGLWKEKLPWEIEDNFSRLLEFWREEVEKRDNFFWIRALRPLEKPFGENLERIFTGHKKGVIGTRVINYGCEIVSWTKEGEVIKWEVSSGKKLISFQCPKKLKKITLSYDGNMVGALGHDKKVYVWTLTGKKLLSFPAPEAISLNLMFTNKGYLMAWGMNSELWDPISKKQILKIPGYATFVSHDLSRLLYLSHGHIYVKDVKKDSDIIEIEPKKGDYGIRGVLSSDGRWAATTAGSKKPEIKIWDLNNGKCKITIKLPEPRFSTSLHSFSSDGKYLLAYQGNGHGLRVLRLWDWMKKELAWEHNGRDYGSVQCTLRGDNKRIAVADMLDGVRVYDVTSRDELCRFHGHKSNVNSLKFLPGGEALVTASSDKTVRIFDLRMKRHILPRNHHKPVVSLQISPDQKFILSCSSEVLYLWNLTTGLPELILRGNWASAYFGDDSNKIVTIYRDYSTGEYDYETIWDRKSGDVITRNFKLKSRKEPPRKKSSSNFKIKSQNIFTKIIHKNGSTSTIPHKLKKIKSVGQYFAGLSQQCHLAIYEIRVPEFF